MFHPAACHQARALNGDTPRQRSMVPVASARGSKSVLDLSIKVGAIKPPTEMPQFQGFRFARR